MTRELSQSPRLSKGLRRFDRLSLSDKCLQVVSSSRIPRRRPSLPVGLLTPARLLLHRASQSLRDASFVLGIDLEPTCLTLDRHIRFAVSQIDREDRFFNRALMR